MDFRKLIERGEIAREKEKYDEALKFFELAIVTAGQKADWKSVTQAIGHKLIINKHLFQKSGEIPFLELMRKDAEAYLEIIAREKLPKESAKIPHLRLGDYYMMTDRLTKAIEHYKKALSLVPKTKTGEYAEYLSHYGFSLLQNNDKIGIDHMTKSLTLIDNDKSLRTFHKLVIKAGILGRLSQAMYWLKNVDLGDKAYNEAMKIAIILEKKYKMPMRKKQLTQIRQ